MTNVSVCFLQLSLFILYFSSFYSFFLLNISVFHKMRWGSNRLIQWRILLSQSFFFVVFVAIDIIIIIIITIITLFKLLMPSLYRTAVQCTAWQNAILRFATDYSLQTWRGEKRNNQLTTKTKMAVVLNVDKCFNISACLYYLAVRYCWR